MRLLKINLRKLEMFLKYNSSNFYKLAYENHKSIVLNNHLWHSKIYENIIIQTMHCIITLAQTIGLETDKGFEIPISRQVIAKALKTTRMTVNKAVICLEKEERIIRDRRKIIVLRDKLKLPLNDEN